MKFGVYIYIYTPHCPCSSEIWSSVECAPVLDKSQLRFLNTVTPRPSKLERIRDFAARTYRETLGSFRARFIPKPGVFGHEMRDFMVPCHWKPICWLKSVPRFWAMPCLGRYGVEQHNWKREREREGERKTKRGGSSNYRSHTRPNFFWLVVWNIFYFPIYWE